MLPFATGNYVGSDGSDPKLGKILVSKDYLTEGELKAALPEQRLRIGEVLPRAGRISAQQLNQALDCQEKDSRKLGEILREVRHATDEDISWALNRMDRKLGKILREKEDIPEQEKTSRSRQRRWPI